MPRGNSAPAQPWTPTKGRIDPPSSAKASIGRSVAPTPGNLTFQRPKERPNGYPLLLNACARFSTDWTRCIRA
jgi:hypothetical protein